MKNEICNIRFCSILNLFFCLSQPFDTFINNNARNYHEFLMFWSVVNQNYFSRANKNKIKINKYNHGNRVFVPASGRRCFRMISVMSGWCSSWRPSPSACCTCSPSSGPRWASSHTTSSTRWVSHSESQLIGQSSIGQLAEWSVDQSVSWLGARSSGSSFSQSFI